MNQFSSADFACWGFELTPLSVAMNVFFVFLTNQNGNRIGSFTPRTGEGGNTLNYRTLCAFTLISLVRQYWLIKHRICKNAKW